MFIINKEIKYPQRWSYGVRREKSDYGPYICDIYFGLKQIDYHTCCESRNDANSVGKFWVDWLNKCDATVRYNPSDFGDKWIHWYSIAYSTLRSKKGENE